MLPDKQITKDTLDVYLRELAKEYRKISGKKIPAEIIIVGGASILINYGFRTMTYDIDAVILASSSMKEAINRVGDKYDLPAGWLNGDFQKTTSYTSKMIEHSKYYRTYSNIVHVRTVTAEYLIAMKLMAGRNYKYDQTDVIGILSECKKQGQPITKEMIAEAVTELYGNWESLPEDSRVFLDAALARDDLEALYSTFRESEIKEREIRIESKTE